MDPAAWAASFGASPAPPALLNCGRRRSAAVPWCWGTDHAAPGLQGGRRGVCGGMASSVNLIKLSELETCFPGDRHLSNLPLNLILHSLLSSWDVQPKCQKQSGPVFSLKSWTARCSSLVNLKMEQRMLSIQQDQASGAGSTSWLRRGLVPMRFPV